MTIATFINRINQLGIKLWLEDSQLKFKAPKGTWNNEIRDELVANKAEVIAFLEASQASQQEAEVPAIQAVARVTAEGETITGFPLSFSQERLWFIDQMEKQSASYNIPVAVSIKSQPGERLNVSFIERAFNLIIARHENLRTVFPSYKGKAQQRILDELHFSLEQVDLSGITCHSEQQQDVMRRCQKEAKTPFNLATGPLLRAQIFKLTEQESVLLTNMHHIISDGWSMGVLVKEFAFIMAAFKKGENPQLPSLQFQYLDYSIWQRKWLGGERENANNKDEQASQSDLSAKSVLQKQLAYWQNKLTGIPESLNLITDFPRPAVQDFTGDRLRFALDPQLTRQLKHFAEQQGCTLYMLLLTVFNVLLYRHTAQEDICIGTPVANRHHEGTESLIGLFINTLVLRNQLAGEFTFGEVLNQVKVTCLEAFEHQDTPFEHVVELVQPERNSAISPLFQVMFVLQNTPDRTLGPGMEARPVEAGISKFDITLEFNEHNTELAGSIEYRSALFKRETIAQMARHFNSLCQAIISNPDAIIGKLALQSEAQTQQWLSGQNQTQTDYAKDTCIHQRFVAQAERYADKVAVLYDDATLTYQQLHKKSHDLALYLQLQGIKPDTLVGVCIEKSLDMVVAVLGILRAGGAYVPMDPTYPDERVAYMVEDSQTAIVLTQSKLKDRLSNLIPKGSKLLALDTQWSAIEEHVAEQQHRGVALQDNVEAHHLVYVIYTSGSTGKPKGVMLEHRSVMNYLHYCLQHYFPEARQPQQERNGASIVHFPLSFDASVTALFSPLMLGKTIEVSSDSSLELFGGGAFLDKGYDFVKLTPGHLLLLKNNFKRIPKTFFERNNLLILGGEALTSEHVDFLNVPGSGIEIINEYGPTEATVGCCVSRYPASQFGNGGTIVNIDIGSPINNTQIYILDEFAQPQPVGIPGELYIAGDGLARGYLNRPELTAEKFVANPFNPGTRMYKTGDLARWLDDGNIEYLGRIDSQVKIRGFRIELGEIEAQLNKHPLIKDSVVVTQGQADDKKLIAFYVVEPSGEEQDTITQEAKAQDTEQTSRGNEVEPGAWLKKSLPEFMLPSAYVKLDAIPLTPNGKIDRLALQQHEVSFESCQEYVAARNNTEQKLVEIWAEVLNLETDKIGVRDNFFELGGDSIKTIQIIAKAIEHQIHFDIRDMFNHQSIADLVAHCDTSKSREILKEEGILEGPVKLSPVQTEFFETSQTDRHHYNQSVLLNLNTSLSFTDLTAINNTLLKQHDALRLRYFHTNGTWQQQYQGDLSGAVDAANPETLGLHRFDISLFDEHARSEFVEKTCDHWQTQFDLENGPIMRWLWFDAKGKGTDQLAIIIHHLAIDGVSWRILLEDLDRLIAQHMAGETLKLADKRSSYRNWVDSLENYIDTDQGQKDLAYWVGQSEQAQSLAPAFAAEAFKYKDFCQDKVSLSRSHTEKLLKHCHKAYGTDINDILLTALMLSYQQISGHSSLLVDMEGHGREQIDAAIDVTRTLGWFTSIYPVHLQLSNPKDIGLSIKEVKTALNAIPNKGVSFSIFRHINQHDTVQKMPQAQVIFNYLGDFDTKDKTPADNHFSFSDNSSGQAISPEKEADKLVRINGMVVFGELSFTFSYPQQWQSQPISEWQQRFVDALELLLSHCSESTKLGFTPGDFPLLTVTLPELDKLTSALPQQRAIALDNIQDIYPLTPLQSGILFETLLARSNENKGMYLTQAAIGINGRTDINILQQAWQLVVNHYDALRMQVVSASEFDSGTGLQVIVKQMPVEVQETDWTDKDDVELKVACEQWMRESKRSGICFEGGPLMRMHLFQGRDCSYLLFEQHHIMLDGWSQNIVLSNLFKLYQALMQQQDYHLPASASYGAYVKTLINRNLEDDSAYWKRYLSAHEERTPLPGEFLFSRQQGEINQKQQDQARDNFTTTSFSFCKETTAQLEQLLKQYRITNNTALQFVWGLLLHLHSGNQTVTFGSVSSGRSGIQNIKHGDQMVGLCINTTPTCVTFDAQLNLLEHLRHMQARESAKLSYEVTPLPHIQSLLGLSNNHEFFQSLFVYENYPVEKISDSNHLLKDFIGNEAPNYPLSVLAMSGETLEVSFTWDRHYYSEDTIAPLMAQFERLTKQLIAVPEAKLAQLSLISAQEKNRLLIDYNQTQQSYAKEQCIHNLFAQQVAHSGDDIAVVFEKASLSYQQLYERSHSLALYLQAAGVGPDILVGLCMERSLDMVVAMLGILQAGGAYVPLDPTYPNERVAYMLDDCQTKIVLTQEALKNKLQLLSGNDTKLVALDSQWSAIQNCAADLLANKVTLSQQVTSQHLAYVIYTSGSTGNAKGVAIEHHSAVALISWAQRVYGAEELSGVLAGTSISFDLSVYEIFLTLASGGKVILATNVLGLMQLENKQEITLINTVPSAMEELVKLDAIPESVLTVNLAGEPLLPGLVDKIYQYSGVEKVYDLYGPSEDTTYSTFILRKPGAPQTIGRPISNTQAYVLDQYNNPVPAGVPGELHLSGDGLARGYLNRTELTDEKFVSNPFAVGTRMYKTGDLVRWLDDGNIEYIGRIDNQVKIRGFRIELGEIENRLKQNPGIADCVVVAQEHHAADKQKHKQLVAFYVAASSSASSHSESASELSAEDLRAGLQAVLPEYMVPSAFVNLTSIPLTPNGKVDRLKLTMMDVSVQTTQSYVAPRNQTEQKMVAIWAEILDVPPQRIGVNDSFFELGGHSLLATQLISKVRREFDVELPLVALFEHPDIASFVIQLKGAQGTVVPTIQPVSRVSEAGNLINAFPMSYAQERVWFIEQFSPGNAGYNMPGAVLINGELDITHVEKAFNQILKRHESLRTIFPDIEGKAQQIILENVDFHLRVTDLSGETSEQELHKQALSLCNAEAATEFNLSQSPLIRAQVIKLSDAEHILMWNMHHIVSDGWSMGIIADEFSTILASLQQGLEPLLPELPIQYADYTVWQRQILDEGGVLEQQMAYWQNKLAGVPESLDLVTDFPRSTVENGIGARCEFALNSALTEQLKSLSDKHGSTLFMTLLAAFNALFYRYTGQQDICIGSPIANRHYGETEGLVGMFVNTLALRNQVQGEAPFSELLEQVKRTCLEAYEHQDAPFEKIVELVQPERNMAISPLFQVMVALQNAPKESKQAHIRPYPLENTSSSKFDLSITFSEADGALKGSIEYSTSLYKLRTVERIAEHFFALCQTIVKAPSAKVSELNFIGEDEKQQLLRWNDTATDYPVDKCMYELFEEQVIKQPDAVAAIFRNSAAVDTTITYGELNARANQLARYLQKQGVEPNTLVGLCIERSIDMLVSLLAILKSGAAYLPLDPNYPKERIQYMINDSQVRWVISQSHLTGHCAAESLICVDNQTLQSELRALDSTNIINGNPGVAQNNLAYVIYTSGSTGKPKGVMLEQRNLSNFLCAMRSEPGMEKDDRLLAVTSFSFDIHTLELYLPLIVGGCVIICSSEDTVSPTAIEQLILDHQVTMMQATPATWKMLLNNQWQPAGKFKALCGGEALNADLKDELLQRDTLELWNMYGPTETAVWSATKRITDTISLGAPIANTQFYVLDKHLNPVPVGAVGELFIGGDGLARGYLNLPELSNERFIANPFSDDASARLYRTGDLVRWRSDIEASTGDLEYISRTDQQVKIRGFRIELGEIESRLNQHADITDSIVVVKEMNGNKQLVAFYVTRETELENPLLPASEELRNWLQQTLPDYMLPSAYVSLQVVPLTPNGKVDRKALVQQEVSMASEEAYVAPRNTIEMQLVQIWAELLNLDASQIGVNDNFFELGGHSLLATQVVAKIQNQLEIKVPVKALFSVNTLAEVAEVCQAVTAQNKKSSVDEQCNDDEFEELSL